MSVIFSQVWKEHFWGAPSSRPAYWTGGAPEKFVAGRGIKPSVTLPDEINGLVLVKG